MISTKVSFAGRYFLIPCTAPSLNTLLGTTADLQTKDQSEVTIVTTHVPEVKHEVDVVTTEEGTVKPVLSGHSKIDKTKVLKTNGSLMKVESIAKCSLGAFCNTFKLHYAKIGLKNEFLSFFLSES